MNRHNICELILRGLIIFCTLLLISCSPEKKAQNLTQLVENKDQIKWSEVDSIDIKAFNSDLIKGKSTVDLGVYFPSNLDSGFHKVTLKRLMDGIVAAKEIFAPTNVQINLLWVKTAELDPKFFSIQAHEVPEIPETEYVNLYQHMQRHPSKLTEGTRNAFETIVEIDINNDRTVFLIVLQDVFYPFLTVSEGRNWTMKSVRTGGMSFPSYAYLDEIPKRLRGVITITNLSRPDRYRRTIAHELGHKLMNVSHEYKETHPGFEVFADGGLMLYGDGEDIPSGKSGRWHQERLMLSPYLYMMNENGEKQWNPDYKEHGHYYDPIYGTYVVHFKPQAVIDKDW